MSSRLSLHDCTISIRIPTPPSPLPDTPEQIALQSLSSTRDQTEAYIGETIFLLLTLSPKESGASSEALNRAIDTCDDPYVYMGSLPHAVSNERPSCRLPVMRETRWLPATQDGSRVVCKALWVLVRSPPQSAEPSRALAMVGRQNIVLSLREMSVPNVRNSSVWATIDRASRLFGKSVALYATRTILLCMPVEIGCECVRVAAGVQHSLVCVSVRNSTSDANISVVPPYINVSSSRVVRVGADEHSHGRSAALHGRYEFVLLTDDDSDDDSSVGNNNAATEQDVALSKQRSADSSCEDYALFIPSFNHLIRHAATLGPREVYNFVFRIVHKSADSDAHERENKLLPTPTPPPPPPRLTAEECIQTSVAVAWNCAPEHDAKLAMYVHENMRRELSAGGVLAAGKRSTVAVHVTSFNWRPAALARAVVVSFSAPERIVAGSRTCVSMSVCNQTERELSGVKVRLQQGGEEVCALLALRTVVVVGDIAAGGETRLQVPCVALRAGALNFGRVCVVDARGVEWETQSAFCAVVHDEHDERAAAAAAAARRRDVVATTATSAEVTRAGAGAGAGDGV